MAVMTLEITHDMITDVVDMFFDLVSDYVEVLRQVFDACDSNDVSTMGEAWNDMEDKWFMDSDDSVMFYGSAQDFKRELKLLKKLHLITSKEVKKVQKTFDSWDKYPFKGESIVKWQDDLRQVLTTCLLENLSK